LGVGDLKPRFGLNLISGPLTGYHVSNVACGDTFTLCSTTECLVFSWGNKKDGRLGLDSSSSFFYYSTSTNTNLSSTVSLPKPIFGSLHFVSDMRANSWNSIVIAEKILNTKPVRTVSYADYIKKETKRQSSDIINRQLSPICLSNDLSNIHFESNKSDEVQIPPNDKNLNNEDDSQMPDWLKQDFDDFKLNDLISIDALESKSIVKNDNNKIKSLEDALSIISQLRLEIKTLKEENEKVYFESILLL
jgi:NIMA (never in mitosis gene a)-related kinase 9